MRPAPARRPRKGPVLACPICGNASHFSVYLATVKVHHLAQLPSGRWRCNSSEPKRHDATIPLLLVCESCAYPIGQPSHAVLSATKSRRRRR